MPTRWYSWLDSPVLSSYFSLCLQSYAFTDQKTSVLRQLSPLNNHKRITAVRTDRNAHKYVDPAVATLHGATHAAMVINDCLLHRCIPNLLLAADIQCQRSFQSLLNGGQLNVLR